MLNFKMPKLISIYKVSKGKIWYVCSCGKLASMKLVEYNRHLRCKSCTVANDALKFLPVAEQNSEPLFDKFYNNGLLEHVEAICGTG